MGTIVEMKAAAARRERPAAKAGEKGEVVIFPGVRIERHDIDLSHRVRDSAGRGDFDGLGGGRRPRKTS
ncbi:hypothetical protein BH10PSE9_BH10PSE9_08580 [soil metagenome]